MELAAAQLIDQTLKKYPFGDHPKELYQPMRYMFSANSDRRYSSLTLWGCHLFDGDINKALIPGLGVEVFHNFLLLHWDVIDGNHSRNDQESVHIKWDDNVAILTGDVMMFKTYELLIQVDATLIKPVLRLFNKSFARICEVKQLHINKSHQLPDHHKTAEPKFGNLAGFGMQLGGLIAGGSLEHVAVLGAIGQEIGNIWEFSSNTFDGSEAQTNLDQQINSVEAKLVTLDCQMSRMQQFLDYIVQNTITNGAKKGR